MITLILVGQLKSNKTLGILFSFLISFLIRSCVLNLKTDSSLGCKQCQVKNYVNTSEKDTFVFEIVLHYPLLTATTIDYPSL